MKYDAKKFLDTASKRGYNDKPEGQLINEEFLALCLAVAVAEAERLRSDLATEHYIMEQAKKQWDEERVKMERLREKIEALTNSKVADTLRAPGYNPYLAALADVLAIFDQETPI